jgi:protein-disulfide isomerase/rhodanese-related sulfurtransferase/uncharacterized membrane protein
MRKPLLLALGFLGLFDSLYLWWVYTSASRPMVCLGTGCDVVRASPFAHLYGVPVPAFGAAMYGLLVLLVFLQPLLPPAARTLEFVVFGISTFAFLTSLYLTGIEAFVLHAWCAWCVVSALTVTFIFLLSTLEVVRPAPKLDPALALGYVRRNLVVSVLLIAAGVPAFYWLSRHGELPPLVLASHEALDERLVRPDSHVTGNPDAAVTVVEWGDFECPSCGMEAPTVRELRQKYGNRIRFVFRQFPLRSIHPQAEKAAEASECAAEQGKFWEAMDKIYAEQNDLSEPALMRDAADLGLDQSRFKACLESGAMGARVRRDMEDGRALHVDRTPTFFVGGHVMAGPVPLDSFAQAIDLELRSHGALAQSRSRLEARDKPDARRAAQPSAAQRPSGGEQAAASDPSSAAAPTGLLGQSPGDVFSQYQQPGIACSEEEARKRQPTLIHTDEALRLFRGPAKALFVDVRPAGDFRNGHIRGAVNMPVAEMPQRWSALPHDQTIVFYESGRSAGDICAWGRAAGRILLEHGFAAENVKVYQDGLAAWQKAGLPVER